MWVKQSVLLCVLCISAMLSVVKRCKEFKAQNIVIPTHYESKRKKPPAGITWLFPTICCLNIRRYETIVEVRMY